MYPRSIASASMKREVQTNGIDHLLSQIDQQEQQQHQQQQNRGFGDSIVMSQENTLLGSFDHKKQGLNFVNEDNIKARDLRKSHVGQSVVCIEENQFSPMASSSKIILQAAPAGAAGFTKQIFPSGVLDQEQLGFTSMSNQRVLSEQEYFQDMNFVKQSDRNGNQVDEESEAIISGVFAVSGGGRQQLYSGAFSLGMEEDLNQHDRNILAPTESQQILQLRKKSIDSYRSSVKGGAGGKVQQNSFDPDSRGMNPSLESPMKMQSRELDSIRKGDLQKQRSGFTNQNTELKERTRNGTIVTGSAVNKAVFSLKFLISIKPKLKRFFSNHTVFGRTRLLNKSIRHYIDDASDYAKYSWSEGNCFVRAAHYFMYLLEKLVKEMKLDRIPLFDPESKVKIVINSIIVSYNLFYMIMISVVLIFDAHLGDIEHTFTYIAMTSWITEMLVEMNTACYHNNHFITDRRVIMRIYAKEYFFFEILPLIFEGRTSENTLINVLLHLPLLLKIKGMSIILAKLEFYILQILEKHYIFSLFKLVMQMLMYGHIVACCWNLIVKIESNIIHSITWIDGSEIESDHWWKKYLIAQYWAFSVMMNVTTKPTTPLELGFTSLVMLLSCIAFGYLLSTVAGIIGELNRGQKDYKRDLNILNQYMKRKKVDLGVKRRVNINLKTYYQQKSRDNLLVEKEALEKLSSSMLYELNCQANSRIFKQFPFFMKLFSEQTITKVYSIMEEEVYAPQQIILTKNTSKTSLNDQFLYFIIRGEVNVFVEHFIAVNEVGEKEGIRGSDDEFGEDTEGESETQLLKLSFGYKVNEPCIVRKVKTIEDGPGAKKQVSKLKSGQIFGAYSFFTGIEREMDMKCKEFTTLVKISRNRFLQILSENRKDYERFKEIQEKLISNRLVEDIPDMQCPACDSKGHVLEHCMFGHFDKSNLQLFFKHNHSVAQDRGSPEMRVSELKKKSNSRIVKALVNKQIVDFRCKNGIEYFNSDEEEEDDDEDEDREVGEDANDGGDGDEAGEGGAANTDGQSELARQAKSLKYNIDDDSKLVFMNQNQPYNPSPPLSKFYPTSDIEINRLEEEVLKSRSASSKHMLAEFEENVSINEEIKMPNQVNASIIPQRSRSTSKKQLQNRHYRQMKSILKYNEQGSVITPSVAAASGGAGVSEVINQTSSFRKQANGFETQDSMFGNSKRKKSNMNAIVSPKHGPYSGAVEGMGLGPFGSSQHIDLETMQKRRSFIQTQSISTMHGFSLANSHLNPNQPANHFHAIQHASPQLMHGSQTKGGAKAYIPSAYSQHQLVDQQEYGNHSYFTRILTTGKNNSTHGASSGVERIHDIRKIETMMVNHTMIDDHNLIWNFDKQQDFVYYFPYFNCANVIRRIQTYQNKQGKFVRKGKHIKKPTEILSTKKKNKVQSVTKISSFSRVPNQKDRQNHVKNFPLDLNLNNILHHD